MQYLEFIGDRAGYLNAELRFPFIEAMLTPIGVLGGIRGVLFANMGGAGFGETTGPARPGRAVQVGVKVGGNLHADRRLFDAQRVSADTDLR